MSLPAAMARVQAGDLTAAETLLNDLIARDANNAEALHMRGLVRFQRNDPVAGLADIEASLALNPNQSGAHFNRGNMLLTAGRFDDALQSLTRATTLAPRDISAWLNRAAAERGLGRDEAAASSYSEVLRLDPRHAGASNDRATSLARLGRYDEALRDADAALAIDPQKANALTNRGKILMELERYEESSAAFEAALKIDPARGGAWNDFGNVLMALGRDREAVAAFDNAAKAPVRDFSAGHPAYNKGLLLLSRGAYPEGFALYTHRAAVCAGTRPEGAANIPEWDGAQLRGTLRIWAEQGVGDQLLFTRLLPLVLQRASKVDLECDARLAPMLKRAHSKLNVIAAGAPFANAAAQIAMGDLARALQVTPAQVAALPPVLKADAAKVDAARTRYERLARGRPVVGIAWASPRGRHGRLKGAGLSEWRALLAKNYCFVSLQYEPGEDIAASGSPVFVDDKIDQIRSLDDFAAQIDALDLIVSVSNTTVHMAGALGAPTVVMAPPGRGLLWYWGFKGERTPWYPTVRIVRRALGAPWSEQVGAAAIVAEEALKHAR